jgi:hypothetical protein
MSKAKLHDTNPARPKPWTHPACWDDDDLLAACTFERERSGGPGGQHRNRVETKVVLTHTASGVMAQAGERREPEVNKRVAIRRLRLALATHVRTGVPIGEIGSELWKSRLVRKKQKDGTVRVAIACNEEHRDYPSMLAEALDVIYDAGLDLKRAALRLETSQAQLVKLIAEHRPALAKLNEDREGRGLRVLK